MNDDREKAFNHLYAALREYHALFIDGSLKACGFFLLAMGWVLTSETARKLIDSTDTKSPFLRGVGIFGLVLSAGAFVVLQRQIIQVTNDLYRELDALEHFPRSYYDFRVLKPRTSLALIAVAVSPCIVIVVFLLSMWVRG